MSVNEKVLSFVVEWFDPQSQLLKKYLLRLYCDTREVDMNDLSSGRKFLKRTALPNTLTEGDFYLNATILLLSRDLKLVQYGDNATRAALDSGAEKTVVIVTPRLYDKVGKIMGLIEREGLSLVDLKVFNVPSDTILEIAHLLGVHPQSLSYGESNTSVEGMTVAMAFMGVNSIQKVCELISSDQQIQQLHRQVDGRVVAASGQLEMAMFTDTFLFQRHEPTATYNSCTCCIIKPHIVKARRVGEVLDEIVGLGYEISAMQLFVLERPAAAEFYEVYHESIKEYDAMVDELVSGPVVALEVRGEDVVKSFRISAGPWDVDMANQLYPDSLRAKFGKGVIQNGIHCTDLSHDAVNEVAYFFDILF